MKPGVECTPSVHHLHNDSRWPVASFRSLRQLEIGPQRECLDALFCSLHGKGVTVSRNFKAQACGGLVDDHRWRVQNAVSVDRVDDEAISFQVQAGH